MLLAYSTVDGLLSLRKFLTLLLSEGLILIFIFDNKIVVVFLSDLIHFLTADDGAPIFPVSLRTNKALSIDFKLLTYHGLRTF